MTQEEKVKRSLAKKYGLTLGQMDEIVKLQGRFVSDVIGAKADKGKLYFPSVRLPGFGVFYCSQKKLEYTIRQNKNKLNETI